MALVLNFGVTFTRGIDGLADLPSLPPGFAFVIDGDGNHLVDGDGNLLIVET